MSGRMMPVECEHGVTVDWGDFGPDDDTPPPRCPDCDREWFRRFCSMAAERLEAADPADRVSLDDLVIDWCAIGDLIRRAKLVEGLFEAEVAASIEGTMEAGGMVLERKWQPQTMKWDRDAATKAAWQAAFDQAGGSPDDLLDLVSSAFRFEPRVGGLRALGLNADVYREVSREGRWRVMATKAEHRG